MLVEGDIRSRGWGKNISNGLVLSAADFSSVMDSCTISKIPLLNMFTVLIFPMFARMPRLVFLKSKM